MTERNYLCLSRQVYNAPPYSLVPIRDEDKYVIMQMRNDQIYHLRQAAPLTKEEQEKYFAGTVAGLFQKAEPGQILFSFLQNGECIGYGGLVHINWIDKHAEISFIIKPELEKDYFSICWKSFLEMLQDVAFNDLKLHKIFTYAFDLRPKLYEVLEGSGFIKEAILKEHCLFDGKFIDVIIHSKIRKYADV